MKLMPQFQAQVPDPLRHHLPAFLPPGRVRAPAVRVLFGVFICQRRFKGTAMQVQFDDIGGGERPLRQVGEEQFIDDARTRDPNRALLLACWMGGYHHAAGHALRPYRHCRAVVEAAHDLTFWTRLKLIGGQVQTRLNERVIEHGVLFATRHKGKASQIGEHGSGAILSVEPQQGMLRRKLGCCKVARDRGESLAQFRSVAAIASVAKTAELCGIKTDMSRVIELAHPFPLGFLLSAVFPIQPYAF